MTNAELVRQLRTASVQCDEMRLRDFGYLMKCAAEAIEELQKDLEWSKEYEAFWEKEANEALRHFQVAIASKPRWIPVEGLLPTQGQNVLIVSKSGGVGEGQYNGNGWTQYRWTAKLGAENVTHWMPLPNPPAKGREE